MRITTISDTHTKHMELNGFLPGGDILIHAGDISNRGSNIDIEDFCEWFDSIDNYNTKVFIAGNHDFGFEKRAEEISQIVNSYKWIHYGVLLGNLNSMIGLLTCHVKELNCKISGI
jgi:3',5'-cyclic AMP phosphodiesterase CpdA